MMKAILILFCTTVFSLVPKNLLSQNSIIKIQEDRELSVEDVLDLIGKQTDYTFIYDSDLFKNLPKIQIKKGSIKANELLANCFSLNNYVFSLENGNTVIIKRDILRQQEITITGKVTDINGVPLPGVTVYVTNHDFKGKIEKDFIIRGTSTDFDGQYSVRGEVGNTLVASFMGYEMYSENIVEEKSRFNIILKEQISALEEVLVVGYGTTKKKDLTGSVGSVDSEEIQQIQTQSVDQALIGKVSGVYIQPASGEPGAGAYVQVRGLTQIRGDNQPLYVIDGVPVAINPNGIQTFERQNPLLAIHPDDIERVDILKDASAAAIYGSRAANGVVIVTTKRGKSNQAPRLSFSASSTFQNVVDKYDFLDNSRFISMQQTAAEATLDLYRTQFNLPDFILEQFFPQQWTIANNPENFFGTADTDWQDLMTNDNALWTQYNVSLNGGTDKVNYFTSLGVSDQDGVMKGNNFKRYNFSANIDATVTNYFKVGTSITYNYSKSSSKGFNSLLQGNFRPDLPAFNEDGSFTTFVNDNGLDEFTVFGDLSQTRISNKGKNLIGNIYGEISLLEGLKFRSQLSLSQSDNRNEDFFTSRSSRALFDTARPGAQLIVSSNRSWTSSFYNTLNYNQSFGVHSINAVAGISYDRTRIDSESQQYRGFPDDEILTNINSASFFDEASSTHLDQGLNSIFGRVNYNYDNKYLATFTARRDGSTKFGPENKFGFFPSGAIAWNMHNEEFLKENATINQLKLRASMGKVGSDNLPSFTYLAYYQAGELYDGQNGLAVTGVPNQGIRWEETEQLDLGLEFALFNSRLRGELVYYEKNTNGIILPTPLAYETGFTTWENNIADVTNDGWELTIGGDIVRSKKFTWNSSFNIATVNNKVDNLYNADIGFQTGIVEGEPIGVITGYDVIKIAQTQEEIDELNTAAGGMYQSSLTQPGDYIFRDINGDGIVNTDDRGPIGSPVPDFFGGWNNQITYGNWNFSMNWNFVQGVDRHFEEITNLYFTIPNWNKTTVALDTWTPDNTDASYARLASPTHGGTVTSRSIVDASYIKLRSASIGYSLPKEWMGNIGLSSIRLSLSGNNLITISDYPGLDPESLGQNPTQSSDRNRDEGLNGGATYPNSRNFTFSINATF
ncbi:SusC/RagA family TonB-linked outer membrane protein [Aestuariibaculum marinum]|uniref:TonB-dependent receptor n=1 Tax=Aestuariibaculum marinum TaxID=2683592 RepID=A0A8J6U7U6_9FLAO|nr:TonB-dependent receptor [Aestuariibaculum marinum]MBD0825479.1 TonB-dependent receptor [Aestuariibaculum marinum]